MREFYDKETEALMRLHYSRQSEKGRRSYAAIESKKLGFGGFSYIVRLFGMSTRTLNKGLRELSNPALYSEIPEGKERRTGGGRKKI